MVSEGLPVYEVISALIVTGELATADVGAERVTPTDELTVRSRAVELVGFDVPYIIIGYVPVGVAPEPEVVKIVSVLIQVEVPGLHEDGLKVAEDPWGRPDTEKLTGAAVPPVLVAVMVEVLPVVAPCTTEILFDLDIEKVNVVTARLKFVVLRSGPLS